MVWDMYAEAEMRMLITALTAGVAAACSATATAMPGPQAAVRKVEVIALAPEILSRKQTADAQNTSTFLADPNGEAIASKFRVHDLSRRWVEYRMAEQFSEVTLALPLADTFGLSAGEARIDHVPAGTSASAASLVRVPYWMRTGAVPGPAATAYRPGCAPAEYRPTGFLRSQAEFRRASFYGLMSSIACEYGIPVGLFDAMIIQESRYDATIASPKNAFGLTQLMPGTAAELGVNRYAVEGNLRGGARYLRRQLIRFGHYHLALAAYNAGPGRVRNGKVPRIRETMDYVGNVLNNWARLGAMQRRTVLLEGSQADAALPPNASLGLRQAHVAIY